MRQATVNAYRITAILTKQLPVRSGQISHQAYPLVRIRERWMDASWPCTCIHPDMCVRSSGDF